MIKVPYFAVQSDLKSPLYFFFYMWPDPNAAGAPALPATGILACSLRQQLLATLISTASQIQMENGSHSAALLIMYGTDRAARLRTTGGPRHVPVKPFGYVPGINHVSW